MHPNIVNISRYFVDSSSLDWAGSGCSCVCLLYAQHLAVVEGEDRAGGQRDAAGEADGLQPRPGLTQLKIYHRLQIRAGGGPQTFFFDARQLTPLTVRSLWFEGFSL